MENKKKNLYIDQSINYKDFDRKEDFLLIKHLYHDCLPEYTSSLCDDEGTYKKSVLVSQWIPSYVKLQEQDDKYYLDENKKYRTYKKGQIIYVNLGFKVGSELGGFHYCVVLNNHDSNKSSILTVAPLSSNNSDKAIDEIYYTNILIEKGFFSPVLKQLDKEANLLYDKVEFSTGLNDLYYQLFSFLKDNNFEMIKNQTNKFIEDNDLKLYPIIRENLNNIILLSNKLDFFNINLSIKELDENIKESLKLYNRIILTLENKIKKVTKLKTCGSIINLDQITTISKFRIKSPCHSKDFLYKVKFNSDVLDQIDHKIKELYLKYQPPILKNITEETNKLYKEKNFNLLNKILDMLNDNL